MTHNCTLCNKTFPSKSQLERHKNIKIPCNQPKESTDCIICDAKFPCLAKLEMHKESNKHKNKYNVYVKNLNITNKILINKVIYKYI